MGSLPLEYFPRYCVALARGFTLIEILVVTSLLAILIAVGIPSFSRLQNNFKLQQAAETIADHLRYARSVAIKRNEPAFVSFYTDAQSKWCYSISTLSACDCRTTNNSSHCPSPDQGVRHAQLVKSDQFNDIILRRVRFGNSTSTRFDPIRGTAKFGSLELAAPNGASVQIRLSILGRVRLCMSAAQPALFSRYPVC